MVPARAPRLPDLGNAFLHVSAKDAGTFDSTRRRASSALLGLSPRRALARLFGDARGSGDAQFRCLVLPMDHADRLLCDRASFLGRFRVASSGGGDVRALLCAVLPRVG